MNFIGLNEKINSDLKIRNKDKPGYNNKICPKFIDKRPSNFLN